MLNTLNINLKTDIKNDRPTALGIKLMSQDKNNNQFILRFTNGGEPVNLDNTYTVEILTKFTNSGASRLTSAIVRQDYATWQFDTAYITQDETVYNYVYVRKAGSLVVSADANAFYFDVGLSEIDKGAGRVAEVYDENYQKYLDEFKDNVNFEEIAQAESDRKTNEDIRQANELLREENYTQKVDTAIVEADVVAKVDNKVTELTPQINDLTAQLAQTKSEAERKRKLEDLDPEVLSAIEGGEGTSFNLLSIPQPKSVTPATISGAHGINIINGKFYTGGVGSSVVISDSSLYAIALDPIPVQAGDVIYFSHARYTTYYRGVDDNDIVVQLPIDAGGVARPMNVTVATGVTKFYLSVFAEALETFEIRINGVPLSKKTIIPWLGIASENLEAESVGDKNIKEGAVTPKKIAGANKVNIFTNKFNKSTMVRGEYHNGATGLVISDPSYVRTHFIGVSNGDEIIKNNAGFFVFFDKNYNFIRGQATTKMTITDANVAFVTASTLVSNLNDFFVGVTGSKYSLGGLEWIDDRDVISTSNVYDSSKRVMGEYHSLTTGQTVMDSTKSRTHFMPVEKGQRIYRSGTDGTVFFDKNYNFIASKTGSIVDVDIDDVAYATFTITNANVLGLAIYITTPNQSIGTSKVSTTTNNIINKLHLPDFSGTNEPWHPSVIYIPDKFNGYKYWLAQTPYPLQNTGVRRDRWECPVVYKSNDGVNWITVADPLDDLTPSEIADGSFMSDPHIFYREDTKTLEVWYRLSGKVNGTYPMQILRKTTQDGVNWTTREYMTEINTSANADFIQSPSVIWDDIRKVYRVWHPNSYGMWYTEMSDDNVWSTPQTVTLDVTPPDNWHADVALYDGKYHLLIYNRSPSKVDYYVSDDGMSFKYHSTPLDGAAGNPLLSEGLYRCVSLKDEFGYIRFYISNQHLGRCNVSLITGRSWNEMMIDDINEINLIQNKINDASNKFIFEEMRKTPI